LIGLDVHDVSGYFKGGPDRSLKPGLKNLRTVRTMEKGIMITIEPGLYFRDFLLKGELGDDLAIDLKYLNVEKI